MRLVKLFRANWAQIEGQQKFVTKEYLATAAAEATKQLDLIRNDEENPARKLADAAYSLWYYDYNEAMLLGRYLTRRDPDSIYRFPGVRPLMTSKGSGSADEAEPQAQDDAPPPVEPSEAQALDGEA